MAKIWMAKEGSDPTRDGPWLVMSLSECTQKLGLQSSNFLCDLSITPKFGDVTKAPAIFSEARIVVVQLDTDEATQHKWKPGFYALEISPKEAEKRCA